MISGKLKKMAIVTTAASIVFAFSGAARADDPLKYPPFTWPSASPENKAEAASPAKKGKKDNGPQRDFSQGKDKSKQWYDGDFDGLDDD